MSVNSKMTAIANAIRAKTGKNELLTLDDMPIEIAGIETGSGNGGDYDIIAIPEGDGHILDITDAEGSSTPDDSSSIEICKLCISCDWMYTAYTATVVYSTVDSSGNIVAASAVVDNLVNPLGVVFEVIKDSVVTVMPSIVVAQGRANGGATLYLQKNNIFFVTCGNTTSLYSDGEFRMGDI